MRTIAFAILLLITGNPLWAQRKPLLKLADTQLPRIEQIAADNSIAAEATLQLISNWNTYPELKQTGRDYTWFHTDPVMGQVPVRVYIPENYRSDTKTPCILLLHGATGRARFSDIDSVDASDDLELFKSLKKEGYIIIRPIADRDHNMGWASNKFGSSNPNITFKVLNDILTGLKHVLNIDDDRVFAFGHSDGSDGAVGLGVYKPDAFAGMVVYNSMMDNLFSPDFYIRNTANRPMFVVHSELDDLRPMYQTRAVVDSLKALGDSIIYKEYMGYTHEDKHLQIDRPRVIGFMKDLSRNPYHHQIYWETDKGFYNTCDWLTISKVNTGLTPASWQKPFIVPSFGKRSPKPTGGSYYERLNKSAVVKASYRDNYFDIQTSGVEEVELKISPWMVDMTKPVTVSVNGKPAYNAKITADKQYLLDSFKASFDRQALWVNAIKLRVE